MSNPPAGWYPDPTGQPNTIRWWNGTKWTNKTQSSDAAPDPVEPAETGERPSLAEAGQDVAVQPETEPLEDGTDDGRRLTAAERARATWTGPRSGDVPSWHWTQREPDPEQQVEREPAQNAEPVEDPGRSSWTLRIAEDPADTAPSDTSAGTSQASPARNEQTGSWQGVGASSGPWQSSSGGASADTSAGSSADAGESADPAAAWWAAGRTQPETAPEQPSEHGQPSEQQNVQESWSSVSWTQQPTVVPQPADTTSQGAASASAAAEQPSDDDETGDLPVVDIEASQATWQSTGPTQWELAAAAQQQPSPATNTWDAAPQQTPPTNRWQDTSQQPTTSQQPITGWQGGQQTQPAPQVPQVPHVPQQVGGWQAGQWQGVGGGGSTTTKGKPKKPPGGGGMLSGIRGSLFIGGPIALVLLILAAVLILTKGDDPKDPSATNTPTTGQPTTQSTGTRQGQSKDPKLHEGERISSDAISFPRRRPPWSDRKRLVPQLQNSSGQYVLLQEKFDGKNDWYANIFVGALGTGSGFDGNPQQTANTLAVQIREALYGDIPATFRGVANGALKRSGKNGWFYQQSVTVNHARLTAKVLTLTVAVFDLGDGSAVAYISDIPTTRPDLRAAESQAYKGITVG